MKNRSENGELDLVGDRKVSDKFQNIFFGAIFLFVVWWQADDLYITVSTFLKVSFIINSNVYEF